MRVVLLGAGGHASDVLGAIEAGNRTLESVGLSVEVVGLLADSNVDMSRFAGRGVKQIGTTFDCASVDCEFYIAAVGYPNGRQTLSARADAAGKTPLTIIHPRAWVPEGTPVGEGTVILAGCCVSPGASIGRHAYLSHGSLMGHDCRAGDFVSMMPGASVSGDTVLEAGVLIGANATVLEGLTVGAGAILGAGAVAVKNIPAGVTAVGIPARF